MKYTMNDMILKKIKRIMERKGIKQNELAEMIGVVPQNLNAYMTGRRRFGEKKIEQIAKALNVPPEALFTITNPNTSGETKIKHIPVISWSKAGAWHEAINIHASGYAEDWIYFDTEDGHAFALRVYEESMKPEFKVGDTIIVSPYTNYISNDFVVAKYDGAVFLKQLKIINDNFLLKPLNTEFEDIIVAGAQKKSLKIVGKVVSKYVNY